MEDAGRREGKRRKGEEGKSQQREKREAGEREEREKRNATSLRNIVGSPKELG